MRRCFALPLLTPFIFALSGCTQGVRAPHTLRLVRDADPTFLDPALSYDTGSIGFVRILYRGLIDYDTKANIVNGVAQSHTVSPDGLTYTFKLRPDVRFTPVDKLPARPIEAEDFRFAMERVLDPATGSDGTSIFQGIHGAKAFTEDRTKNHPFKLKHCAGIEVRGKDTIIYHLDKADTTFLNYMALPFGFAVRREWVQQLESQGKTLSENPDGYGPFTLGSWTHGVSMTLEKNSDYYNKTLPRSDHIEVEIGNSPTLQTMRFERGDNDIFSLDDALPPDFLRLKDDPNLKGRIFQTPAMDTRYVALNTELAPFNNRLVRQAVNYAVNKERIVAFRAGRAELANGILPPGMPSYNPKLRGYDYNPTKARQLLKQAGYKDNSSKPPTLWYAVSSDAWYPDAALSIQQDLSKVGMTIALKGVTYKELKTVAGTRKKCQMSLIGWFQDFPDPSNFLDVLLNGEKITDQASNNRAFYSNPKVNTLLDAALGETNRPKRLRMYSQAEQMIMDDAPWVPLNHSQRFIAIQPWIKHYSLNPAWNQVYEDVEVTR